MKKNLATVAAFAMLFVQAAAPVMQSVPEIYVSAETEKKTTLSDFLDDFETYAVGGYIEENPLFKQNWVNNVLRGGEAQGMDAHLTGIAKVEYENGSAGNKVLHLKNTVGNDSFFHIGPSGDYRVKNFTAGFRLKYLVESVSERSWVGISFRKKAEAHYTGTNNLMFNTQRYKGNTSVSGHAYAVFNGGSPNDFGENTIQEMFKDVLNIEYNAYEIPDAQSNVDAPWINYRLEVNENNYKLFVNDAKIIDCTFAVTSFDYFGYLSLNCCTANVLVDDFYVTNNDTELPPAIDPLPTPVVTLNEAEKKVEWRLVDGANLYAVYINGELVKTAAKKYYQFEEDLAPGEYVVQVKAISSDTFVAIDSPLSEGVTYTVAGGGTGTSGEDPADGGCGSVTSGVAAMVALGSLAGVVLLKKWRNKHE